MSNTDIRPTSREKTKQRENRYPQYVQNKVDRYIEHILECEGKDTPGDQANKERIYEQIIDYRADINPLASYNARRSRNKSKAKMLTVSCVKPFLEAAEMSGKTFFECCMKENKDIDLPENEGWTCISWPTEEMQTACDLIDAMPVRKRDSVLALINKLKPVYYKDFQAQMEQESAEFGKSENDAASINAEDTYTLLRCEDNIGDRMRYTLDYILTGTGRLAKKECDEIGVCYKALLSTIPRHYWLIFNLEDIWTFCKHFALSPHWILFGRQPITVLAKDIQTELIMDEFALLPKQEQKIVIGYAKQLAGR